MSLDLGLRAGTPIADGNTGLALHCTSSAKSREGEGLAQLLAGRWLSRVGVGHGHAPR